MQMFFANGGGSCYILSVGGYNTDVTEEQLITGINQLEKEQEPTMVVIPETSLLPDAGTSIKVQTAMLNHCGKMKNRFAILDIFEGL